MPMLDVFNSDAFNTLSLTTALNKLPFAPSFLGRMGLFNSRGIISTQAVVEERHGALSLVPTSARGTTVTTENRPDRLARSFVVPHLSLTEAVLAEDVQNVRAFGSETALQTVAQLINDRLAAMRQNMEVTHEWHRVGAIQGIVLDADATTEVYNYFTEFGITETEVDFALGTATTDTKAKCTEVIRAIEDALGATMFTGVVGIAGNAWWDAFVSHDSVERAYDRYQDSQFLRTSQRGPDGFVGPGGQAGFDYAGITFYNYRGHLDTTRFIPDDVCRFVPVGGANLFETVYSPADYMETVNTIGQAVYAKQERMPFDRGVELEVQSCPLIYPSRPACLIKGTTS